MHDVDSLENSVKKKKISQELTILPMAFLASAAHVR